MIQRRALSLLVLAVSVSYCSGKSDELAFNQAPLTAMSQCPNLDDAGIAKVCVADDQGNLYSPSTAPHPTAVDGTLVVPSGRKLSIVYVFADGYVPNAADVANEPVHTYAAPYALPLPDAALGGPVDGGATVPNANAAATVATTPCCAEDDEKNRVASHATLAGNVMTVSLDAIAADGMQIAAIETDASLYASRLAPTCTLPGDRCLYPIGFSLRFYVGHRP